MEDEKLFWVNQAKIEPKSYMCGHCGKFISSNLGYYTSRSEGYKTDAKEGYVYLCHSCKLPTYINDDVQVPGAPAGKKFKKEIFREDNLTCVLYNEARNNMKINAYTSVGLCCRKLLMHIAVSCGAPEDLNFAKYVDYLDENGYIPVQAKLWVDKVRDKGNEANHQIILLSKEEANTLLTFIEVLIILIYEMPYRADDI